MYKVNALNRTAAGVLPFHVAEPCHLAKGQFVLNKLVLVFGLHGLQQMHNLVQSWSS